MRNGPNDSSSSFRAVPTLCRPGPEKLTQPLARNTGINFQKASCTLDGCVKIWTSRVDSVATETGKLLSGLTETGNGEDGEDGELGSDGEEVDEETGKKKRKVRFDLLDLTGAATCL